MTPSSIIRILTLLVLLPGSVNLISQTYQPMPVSQATWDITRCWGFYPGGWHDEYSVRMDGTDTIINERIYKKLILVTHHLPGTEHDSVYSNFLGGMREANKQVFIISEYLTIDTIERMVYDFNDTDAGDTIFTQILTNGLTEFIPHIVVSEDEVLIGQEMHRRIILRDENAFFFESWTEGVGSNMGLPYASYWLLTDNSYDLNCFYEQDALQYTNPDPGYGFCTPPLPDIQCAVSTSNSDSEELTHFLIYPNPAYDYLTISSDSDFQHIRVINSFGETVIKSDFTNVLSVEGLSPGFYSILVYKDFKELLYRSNFVKIR